MVYKCICNVYRRQTFPIRQRVRGLEEEKVTCKGINNGQCKYEHVVRLFQHGPFTQNHETDNAVEQKRQNGYDCQY